MADRTQHSETVEALKAAYEARIQVMKGGGGLYRDAYEAIEALEAELAEARAEQPSTSVALIHGAGTDLSAVDVLGPFPSEDDAEYFGGNATELINNYISDGEAPYSKRILTVAPLHELQELTRRWRTRAGQDYIGDEWANHTAPQPDSSPQQKPASPKPVPNLEAIQADNLLFPYEALLIEAREILAGISPDPIGAQGKEELDRLLKDALDLSLELMGSGDPSQEISRLQNLATTILGAIRVLRNSLGLQDESESKIVALRGLRLIRGKFLDSLDDITRTYPEDEDTRCVGCGESDCGGQCAVAP